jgi:hypothetical protein
VGTVRRSLEERFWANVQIGDSCWEWAAARDPDGRGTIHAGGHSGRKLIAPRVAWELMRGPIPPGMFVCHNCPGGDNPGCVNPGHLFLGTDRENKADMCKKGLNAKGSRQGEAKLCEPLVRVLRRAHEMGATCRFMSRLFGVGAPTMWKAVHRETWKHVP